MPRSSAAILEQFRTTYGKDIDLSLRPAYRDLLSKFGNPQFHLPPVLHVAGTNGKGSTCAFMRAILEAAGYKVHVYTSPHLVSFHERIRIAGALITENELASILQECETMAIPRGVSYFEVSTVAAFVAFTRHAADFTILETGLGGRLDATNVVDRPLATLITRLSYDHREYLGENIDQIAREKAGIMRKHVPCFVMQQPERLALRCLQNAARDLQAPLSVEGIDWHVEETATGFRFKDSKRTLDLPAPRLLGRHQYQNAGLAMAALEATQTPLPLEAFQKGMQQVEWPARLQRLDVNIVPEVWLDGGHNDSAGEVLAAQIERWQEEDQNSPKPLYVVLGMLTTKRPREFLGPFVQAVAKMRALTIEGEPLSFRASDLAQEVQKLGISDVGEIKSVHEAFQEWGQERARILICGSLYLAGNVLAQLKAYQSVSFQKP